MNHDFLSPDFLSQMTPGKRHLEPLKFHYRTPYSPAEHIWVKDELMRFRQTCDNLQVCDVHQQHEYCPLLKILIGKLCELSNIVGHDQQLLFVPFNLCRASGH